MDRFILLFGLIILAIIVWIPYTIARKKWWTCRACGTSKQTWEARSLDYQDLWGKTRSYVVVRCARCRRQRHWFPSGVLTRIFPPPHSDD